MTTVATVNELGSYALNPRGNLWYNDDSSYGQKMLLKMGWRKGKGLGKREDGIKENLKMKFKNTNSGLGYKDDSYTNVMKTDYESILKNLRSEYTQQTSVSDSNKYVGNENQDLKLKSRTVRGKIRYPKLYCAKDVSKYSEKDMKSIFICSLPFKDEKEESKDSGLCLKKESQNSGLGLKEDSKNSELYVKEESGSHLSKPQESYTSHLSVSDYFSRKMKGKKVNGQKKKCVNEVKQEETDYYNKTNYEKEKTNSDSESNKTVCKLGKEKKFQLDRPDDALKSPNKKKHKKKRKYSEIDKNNEDGKDVLLIIEKERKDAVSSNKKQKEWIEDLEYQGTFSVEKTEDKSSLSTDQLNVSNRKKKCHRKEVLSSTDNVELSLVNCNVNSDIVQNKKKKKSHRNDNISTLELLSVTSIKDEVSKNSQQENGLSTEALSKATSETLTNIDNKSSRKKQKKAKNKFNSIKKLKSCLKSEKGEYSVKNVSFNENISYQFIDSVNESTGFISDYKEKISNDPEITASNNNPEYERDSGDNKTEVEDCNVQQTNCSEANYTNTSETVSEQKIEGNDSLSTLPSSNSPHYNPWVESQQQALKMKLYQDLLNGIKEHDILKTTNLSFIKGYGNWGF